MAHRVVLNISDEDWDAMADSVLDPEQWINEAVAGKIGVSRKRLHNGWIPRLRRGGIAIPADDAVLETTIKAHPDYKNRADRDAGPAS